jgi:hypothetical protein
MRVSVLWAALQTALMRRCFRALVDVAGPLELVIDADLKSWIGNSTSVLCEVTATL